MKSNAALISSRINEKIERLIPLIVLLAAVLGLSLPEFFIGLRPLVPWLFGIFTVNGALKSRVSEFGKSILSPVPILVFFISSHVIMPLLALFSASLFFKNNPEVITGYVFLFSGPAAVSGFLWVTIFRGDKVLCLTLILLDNLLAPLILPGTISLLIGTSITIDTAAMAISLVLMVVIPTVTGITLNEVSRGKIPDKICPFLNPFSKICFFLVITTNSSVIAEKIRFNDPFLWKATGLCILLIIGSFILMRIITNIIKCKPEKSVTLFFSVSLRNTAGIITIAIAFFPEETAIPVFISIIIQQFISAIAGKLLAPKVPLQN